MTRVVAIGRAPAPVPPSAAAIRLLMSTGMDTAAIASKYAVFEGQIWNALAREERPAMNLVSERDLNRVSGRRLPPAVGLIGSGRRFNPSGRLTSGAGVRGAVAVGFLAAAASSPREASE